MSEEEHFIVHDLLAVIEEVRSRWQALRKENMDLRQQNASLMRERDSWKKIANEYETALADRGLL